MIITMNSFLEDGWVLSEQFYSFDISLAGTVMYQLQHCVRSIHTVVPNVSRHRLTPQDAILPWEFRMTLYVFPASLDDCTIVTSLNYTAKA